MKFVFSAKKAAVLTALFTLFFGSSYLFAQWGKDRLVVNETRSLPETFFLIDKKIDADTQLQRGDTVLICFNEKSLGGKIADLNDRNRREESSRCPTGRVPYIKVIQAVPGDHVQANGISPIKINSKVVKWSHPLKDPRFSGYVFSGIVPLDSFWVFGETERSLDSRYFGAVSRDEMYYTLIRIK